MFFIIGLADHRPLNRTGNIYPYNWSIHFARYWTSNPFSTRDNSIVEMNSFITRDNFAVQLNCCHTKNYAMQHMSWWGWLNFCPNSLTGAQVPCECMIFVIIDFTILIC